MIHDFLNWLDIGINALYGMVALAIILTIVIQIVLKLRRNYYGTVQRRTRR